MPSRRFSARAAGAVALTAASVAFPPTVVSRTARLRIVTGVSALASLNL